MPTTWVASVSEWFRRRGLEAALALLALAVFLGFLGSVELWGKREQRASAEAIDTLDHAHWLVAQIQGRPRLEKPPLPRWTTAALIALTVSRDEWVVRLPAALSGLGMVGLVYGLGRRMGGRSLGVASGLALTSMGFFVSEVRQAGNDGPLAFFTTLALYAAWRRLHGEADPLGDEPRPGSRGWGLLLYAALGLAFLTKGPVVLMVVALTVVPYLVCAGRLGRGLRLLADGPGLVLFTLLALSWPVPVLLDDPNALRVWLVEMGQKAGAAGVGHARTRLLAFDWPLMTLPWVVIATLALALPFRKQDVLGRPRVWFPWWWAVGNQSVFCLWAAAKPNYYLPCLPGVALLCGAEWVRLTRAARGASPSPSLSCPPSDRAQAEGRWVLQSHWVALFTAAAVVPVVTYRAAPGFFAWSLAASTALAVGVVASAWLWRKGADAAALAPLVGAMAVLVLVGYGAIGPAENARRSHRALAAELDRVLPPEARTVMFFQELDEGLWFYLRGRDLVAVPGSQAKYNDAFRHVEEVWGRRFKWDPARRLEEQKQTLVDWLKRDDRASSYLLIRDERYDQLAPALSGLAEPVYREHGVKRNGLVLLRVTGPDAVASRDGAATGPRRRAVPTPIAAARPSPRTVR